MSSFEPMKLRLYGEAPKNFLLHILRGKNASISCRACSSNQDVILDENGEVTYIYNDSWGTNCPVTYAMIASAIRNFISWGWSINDLLHNTSNEELCFESFEYNFSGCYAVGNENYKKVPGLTTTLQQVRAFYMFFLNRSLKEITKTCGEEASAILKGTPLSPFMTAKRLLIFRQLKDLKANIEARKKEVDNDIQPQINALNKIRDEKKSALDEEYDKKFKKLQQELNAAL